MDRYIYCGMNIWICLECITHSHLEREASKERGIFLDVVDKTKDNSKEHFVIISLCWMLQRLINDLSIDHQMLMSCICT